LQGIAKCFIFPPVKLHQIVSTMVCKLPNLWYNRGTEHFWRGGPPPPPAAGETPMIDGVIFDMDGLMFDTERVWATLWEPALATLGLSYKEGLDVAARGTAGDTMRAVLRRFYGENCDTDAQHIPMAVASSSRMASIRHHLDGWGLTHYFKVIVSGEQFSASKPDPEIFLRAAEALGTARDRTLVLEDSYNGVRAGAAGHFVTVMVPDMAPANDEMRRLYTAECCDLYEVLDGLQKGRF